MAAVESRPVLSEVRRKLPEDPWELLKREPQPEHPLEVPQEQPQEVRREHPSEHLVWVWPLVPVHRPVEVKLVLQPEP